MLLNINFVFCIFVFCFVKYHTAVNITVLKFTKLFFMFSSSWQRYFKEKSLRAKAEPQTLPTITPQGFESTKTRWCTEEIGLSFLFCGSLQRNHLHPSKPFLCILLILTNLPYVFLHYIHEPPLWSSYSLSSMHLHLQHPLKIHMLLTCCNIYLMMEDL